MESKPAMEQAKQALALRNIKTPVMWLLAIATLALPLWALAQPGIPAFTSTPAPGGGQNYSLPVQTLILMTSLTFLPAALLMMTCFTRIIIVLSLLRQAIGTQSAPPNQVLVGLALFLTLFVMGPVFDKIYTDAYLPYQENKISMQQAMDKGVEPLKTFRCASSCPPSSRAN